jgi:cyanophycin synthetase
MITIKHSATFHGPNPQASCPVVVVECHVPEPDLRDAAIAIRKICKYSASWFTFELRPEPVTKATLLAFVADWARAALNEVRGHLRFAQAVTDDGQSSVVLEFHNPTVSVQAISFVVRLLEGAATLTRESFASAMAEFWKLCQAVHPDFQVQFLLDYARVAGIPAFRFLGDGKYWQFGWGEKSKIFFESSSMDDSTIGHFLSLNKVSSKRVLRSLGLPVADSVLVKQGDELALKVERVGYPCVIKPLDRGRSIGVTVRIGGFAELETAFLEARKHSTGPLMLERHVPGDVYRIVVIRGRVWKVIKREVPSVIGDGTTALRELVRQYNEKIEQARRPGSFVGPVPLGSDFDRCLVAQGLAVTDVPEAGQKIRLQSIPLLESGARYFDVTGKTSEDIIAASELIAKTFRLASCGIDFITDDIAVSCSERGAFLELNTTPGLNVPFMAGVTREEIGKAILGDACSRLPVLFVLAESSLHGRLLDLLPKPPSLGWVCGISAGVGAQAFANSWSNQHGTFTNVVKNPNVGRVVVISDLATVASAGMPCEHVNRAVIVGPHDDAQDWLDVIEAHSETVVHVRTAERLRDEFVAFLLSSEADAS